MADSDETFKNAGRFLRKLGAQVKDTAQAAGSQLGKTAKQVTGLGRGAVKVELDQVKFAPGATIAGRVVLALPEPVEAKRLVVVLRARQRLVNAGKSVAASHAEVYELVRELGGAKPYASETLTFELTVPPDALDLRAKAPATPLGEVVRTVASAVSPTAGPIEWQVVAELEIAWGRNLAGDVDLVIA